MKPLTTPQTLSALIPLIVAVGWICQIYDSHYLTAGLFFGGALFFYVLIAKAWFRFTLTTLILTYVVTLAAALIGLMQEANSVVLAILGGWAALHFGPKVTTDKGTALEALDEETFQKKKIEKMGLTWSHFGIVIGLVVICIIDGTLEPSFRRAVLEKRYLGKGCAAVEVLNDALLCYGDDEKLLLVDAFFDHKGHQIRYRLNHIEENTALQTAVNYSTGKVDRSQQVRFAVKDGQVKVIRDGYGLLFNGAKEPDIDSGIMIYENDQWLRTEKVTPEALQRLHLPTGEES